MSFVLSSLVMFIKLFVSLSICFYLVCNKLTKKKLNVMVMYTRFNLNILTFRLVKQYGNHQEENSNTSVSLSCLTAAFY